MIADPTIECLFRRGQWLVPQFAGVRRIARSTTSQQQTTSRGRYMENPEQLVQYRAQGATMLEQFRRAHNDARVRTPVDMPAITDGTEQQAVTQLPPDIMSSAVTRDLVQHTREHAMVAEFAHQDLMAATLAQKERLQGGDSAAAGVGGRPRKSINLEKLSLSGKVAEQVQRSTELKAEFESEYKATLADMDRAWEGNEDDVVKKAVTDTKGELLQAKANAVGYIERIRLELEDLKTKIGAADSSQELGGFKNDLIASSKEMLKGDTKHFRERVRAALRQCAQETRKKAGGGRGAGSVASAVGVPSSAPPMHAILLALWSEHRTMGGSIFEAKSGLKPCKVQCDEGKDPTNMLLANPYVKQGFKELAKNMKSGTDQVVWRMTEALQCVDGTSGQLNL